MNKIIIDRILYCYSFSYIITIPVWREWFTYVGSVIDDEFIDKNYGILTDGAYIDYLSGLIVLLAIFLLSFLACTIIQRNVPHFSTRISNFPAYCAVIYITLYISARAPVAARLAAWPITSVILILGMIALAVRYRNSLARIIYFGMKVAVPGCLVITANTVGAVVVTAPEGRSPFVYHKPLAPPNSRGLAHRRRVVWFLFDEWDQYLTFERRHQLELPNLSRLRKEAFFTTRTLQPSTETYQAMPAITTGLRTVGYRIAASNNILVKFRGSDAYVPWRQQDTVFSTAKERGLNLALLSQQMPYYCREFHLVTVACWESGKWWNGDRRNVATGIVGFLRALGRYFPFVNSYSGEYIFFTNLDYRTEFYHPFLSAVKKAITDRQFQFVFSHWLLPHGSFYYDRVSGKFSDYPKGDEGYDDNLVLLDRTIGELRKAMERAGVWKNTTVILSSDHDFRGAIKPKNRPHYTPLIVKFAGQTLPTRYEKEFEARILGPIILDILDGKIENSRELARAIGITR